MDKCISNSLGSLAQVVGNQEKFTNTISFKRNDKIPKYRIKYVAYGRIVVDYRTQKDVLNIVILSTIPVM